MVLLVIGLFFVSGSFAVFDATGYDGNTQVTVCASQDLNAGQLIWLKNVNFSSFNAQPDLRDVRIVNTQTMLEVQRKVVGDFTSTDGSLFFALPADKNIATGVCDKNFFVYYHNASASIPVNNAFNFDGFESYSNGQAIPFSFYNGTSTTAEIQQVVVRSGLQALLVTATSAQQLDVNFNLISPNYDVNLGSVTVDYNAWIYIPAGEVEADVYLQTDSGLQTIVYFKVGTGEITTYDGNTLGAFAADTWFRVNFNYTTGKAYTNRICVFTETALIGCTGIEAANAGIPKAIRFKSTGVGGSFYVDDVSFFVPYQENIFVGTLPQSLIIKIPLDEQSGLPVSTFSLRVTGGSTQSLGYLTSDQTISWTGTILPVNIDINSDNYYARRYTIDGNSYSSEFELKNLQSYLVPIVSGVQTTITVLDSISGNGIGNVTIVSSKIINNIDTNMESHITDSSGRSLFNFFPGDTYTLKYYLNGALVKTESFSATTTSYTTWLTNPFNFPVVVPSPYADFNYSPSVFTIYANDNNFLDLNQSFFSHFQNISKIDLNIFYNLDKNLWSDTNIQGIAVNTNGFLHEDVNLNKPGFDFNYLVHVSLAITFADGNKQTFWITYAVLQSQAIFDCNWTGGGAWNQESMFACWQSWGKNLKDNLPGQLNNANDANKSVTSFLAVLIAFLACIGLFSTVGLDSSGAGIVFVGILGVFFWLGWIFDTLFFIALFALIGMIFLKLTIKAGW